MPSKWIAHVLKTYRAKKSKDSTYKYSQAMKDAKKTYKKGTKVNVEVDVMKKTKRRKKKKPRVEV